MVLTDSTKMFITDVSSIISYVSRTDIDEKVEEDFEEDLDEDLSDDQDEE